MCDDGMTGRSARFEAMDEPPFPTLQSPEPPPARPIQSCFSRSGRRSGSTRSTATATIVSTDLPAPELLRHYGRQLEASGWTPPGQTGSPAAASATWTRADSAGVSQLTLEVSEAARGSGCYNVQMRISNPRF